MGPARDALPYVLYHHEWWNGAGYPSGRAGGEIPEGARLLAKVLGTVEERWVAPVAEAVEAALQAVFVTGFPTQKAT